VRTPTFLSLVPILSLLLAGCGSETPAGGEGSSAPSSSTSAATTPSLLLTGEVPQGVGVLEARKGKKGDTVTVVGRVRDYEDGLAALMLTDDSVPYCGGKDCGMGPGGCKTPWDYCCRPDEASAASMAVEVRGADGKVIETKDLGIRLLDLVVVKGRLETTEAGDLFLVADTGWHLQERPDLPANLNWNEH
jgi:hypothetical protein